MIRCVVRKLTDGIWRHNSNKHLPSDRQKCLYEPFSTFRFIYSVKRSVYEHGTLVSKIGSSASGVNKPIKCTEDAVAFRKKSARLAACFACKKNVITTVAYAREMLCVFCVFYYGIRGNTGHISHADPVITDPVGVKYAAYVKAFTSDLNACIQGLTQIGLSDSDGVTDNHANVIKRRVGVFSANKNHSFIGRKAKRAKVALTVFKAVDFHLYIPFF